jgi:hypothetical protein
MIVVAIATLPFAAIGLLMRAPGPVSERVAAVVLIVTILGQMLAAWFVPRWTPGPRLAWLVGLLTIGIELMSLWVIAGLILLFFVHAVAAMLIITTIVALAFYLTSWD